MIDSSEPEAWLHSRRFHKIIDRTQFKFNFNFSSRQKQRQLSSLFVHEPTSLPKYFFFPNISNQKSAPSDKMGYLIATESFKACDVFNVRLEPSTTVTALLINSVPRLSKVRRHRLEEAESPQQDMSEAVQRR